MQTSDARIAERRISELQRQLDLERHKRMLAEQRAAGLRSAVVRMQAMLARQKATEAERRAEQHAE